MLLLLACLSPQEPSVSDSNVEPTPAPRTLEPGSHTLESDGLERSFELYYPENLPENAALVLAFHGYGGSATGLQGYSGLDAVAEREGFVVAYPQGVTDRSGNPYWEVGYAFHNGEVDDVGLALDLVALLQADLGTDPERVYATGMSNGGDMSYQLACQAGDTFSAVAPVAGCLMGVVQDSCTATQTSLMEIHGTQDTTTPWAGDPDGSDGWGPYLGTQESVGHFVDVYGLGAPVVEELPDLSESDGSQVRLYQWGSGALQVRLYEVQGGKHDWPGAGGNQDIDSAEEIWSFFEEVHE
ncbi:MAG: polyhydroxybutyrate depolymerase [Cognaticolwellia sp.]|jgi:polyhydroxybutyrate depolymerase